MSCVGHAHCAATIGTQSFTHWKANVLDVVAHESGSPAPADWSAKLPLWFRSGESVRMAADTIISVNRIRARRTIEDVRPGALAFRVSR